MASSVQSEIVPLVPPLKTKLLEMSVRTATSPACASSASCSASLATTNTWLKAIAGRAETTSLPSASSSASWFGPLNWLPCLVMLSESAESATLPGVLMVFSLSSVIPPASSLLSMLWPSSETDGLSRALSSVPELMLLAFRFVSREPFRAGSPPALFSWTSWLALLKLLPCSVTLPLSRASSSVPDVMFEAFRFVRPAPEPARPLTATVPVEVLTLIRSVPSPFCTRNASAPSAAFLNKAPPPVNTWPARSSRATLPLSLLSARVPVALPRSR